MTITYAIEIADEMRPNLYSKEEKTRSLPRPRVCTARTRMVQKKRPAPLHARETSKFIVNVCVKTGQIAPESV